MGASTPFLTPMGKTHDSQSAQTLRGKSHRTGYGTFSLSESRESLLAMPSGENEDEVNVFIKSKDQREPAHFGLTRKHLYLYEHQTDGDT